MATKTNSRRERLLPGGKPRYIHVYDNGGETADRYTIVFTGRYRHRTGGVFIYVGCSSRPFHPQGIGQHGHSEKQIDYPSYGHLGKKVSFEVLPRDVQKLVMGDYVQLWGI
jgi:hypothetical protein